MITDKELNLINLSATKKDFYQIWNELLEAAKKTTERWDPESTNESDPGIVLLKLLTACADRLNYNIDKNTLEAFMPSAAQEESMRKLCDMMGYAIKYYRSATTDVTVSYIGNLDNADERLPESGLYIPIFTSITNADKDINYVTTSQAVLLNDQTQVVVPCIEGQIVRCESDTDNIITLAQLDDNNRYYLPELQVAENGIFVYNINDNIKSDLWESVDNLNTQPTKAKVFKFGFDSQEYRPYLQFPNDISSLIEDGLEIYYIRTSGVLGNISARSLSTLEKPTDESWDNYQSSDSFIAINYSPATNGTNPETLTQAYNAFKKTVGTFDTLVTCRDYINKIYSLTLNNNTPLVSNVIVSDIRDDINRAQVICSFNDFGLCYVDKSLRALDDKGKITSDDAITPFDLVLYPFRVYNNLNTKADYQGSFTYSSANFNLIQTMLAKSKTIAHRLTMPNIGASTGDSETSKKDSEIVCIKNYLKLNAKISTTSKVNSIEAALIIENIKANLFSLFNARQVDFGQEIPFDLILEGIENADTRIKNVALEEPILYTKVALADGREFDIASEDTSGKKIDLTAEGKKYYNKLALRNILAGRIRLFNYTNDFNYSFTESDYGTLDTVTTPAAATELGGGNKEASKELPADVTENAVGGGLIISKDSPDVYHYHYAPQYPIDTTKGRIDKLTSELIIDPSPDNITREGGITLNPHEVIKFRAPNFITTKTYPAYVNYYLHLSESSQHSEDAIPATFKTLGDFMYGTAIEIPGNGVNASALPYLHVDSANAQAKTNVEGKKYAEWFINWLNEQGGLKDKTIKEFNINVTEVDNYRKEYGGVFSFEKDHTVKNCYSLQNSQTGSGKLDIAVIDWNNQSIFVKLSAFIKQIQYSYTPAEQTESQTGNLSGVYRVTSAAGTHIIGYCVDAAQISYGICTIYRQFADPLQDGFYIQETHAKEDPGDKKSYTCDGLGKDASTDGISADTEYQLKDTEYLLINYLPSSTSGDANAATEPVNVYYGANTIIKPNFLAVDSGFRHDNLGKGWAKTDGYDFSRANASVTNPSGMFALGASEQIEIRNLVTVILSGNVNLCWRLNTENNSIERDTNYTLGPGEFIYYTNDKKVDIAYYGEGTEVCTGNQGLIWPAGEKVITELEADGLGLADMPWQPMYLTEAQQIVLKEYQYVTLTEGDTLLSLHISESELSGKDDAAHKNLLCNIWKPCTSSTEFPARYSMGDTQYNLPRIAVKGESWAVRSLLEFASGPDTTQTLYREGASITAYKVDENGGERKIITLKPDVKDGVVRPLSFKTSLDLVASVDKLSFTYKTDTTDNSTQATDTNVNSGKALSTQKQVQIRLFEDKPINIESGRTADGETTSSVVGNTSLVLHNLGNSYTKLSMANLRTDDEQDIKYIKLPVVVPSTTARAVMMVYYKPEAESGYTELDNDNAALGILDKESSYELKIFNNPSDASSEVLSTYMSSWTWWKRDGGEEAKDKDNERPDLRDADGNVLGKLTRYYLKPGLNIVSITESTTLYILPDAKKKAMIIFGDPTLYSYDDTTGGLAIALLGYQGEDNAHGSPALTLLKDLRAADGENQFFYNCDIENDVAINLSEDRLFSDETETLAAERTWYDSNNINNKFVISEIDAEYLDTGLQILKSSRY